MIQSSQFGQAEYILSAFDRFGINHGTCFEAGAASPECISNSLPFIKKGWKAYLVEPERHHCEKWESLQYNNVSIFNSEIEHKPNGLQSLFEVNKIPCNVDVLFLDIDGGEYQLLRGFLNKQRRPKVICVEYDNSFPLSIDYVPSEIRCGRQASSISFYKMMSSADMTMCTLFDMIIFLWISHLRQA